MIASSTNTVWAFCICYRTPSQSSNAIVWESPGQPNNLTCALYPSWKNNSCKALFFIKASRKYSKSSKRFWFDGDDESILLDLYSFYLTGEENILLDTSYKSFWEQSWEQAFKNNAFDIKFCVPASICTCLLLHLAFYNWKQKPVFPHCLQCDMAIT